MDLLTESLVDACGYWALKVHESIGRGEPEWCRLRPYQKAVSYADEALARGLRYDPGLPWRKLIPRAQAAWDREHAL